MKMKKTLLALALASAFAHPAQAADRFWACGTGWWYQSCWSGTSGGVATLGQPQDADYVYLVQADATNQDVFYWNTMGAEAFLSSLVINATGAGTMTLHQSKDALAVASEYIGTDGTGAFSQSGGTHTINSWFGNPLVLGQHSGGNGRYNLYGPGALSADNEMIGLSGNGTFNQSSGTHTVSRYLDLGYNSGSTGTYNLSGVGSLTVVHETIGRSGTGTFTQSGGAHTVSSTLMLGFDNGSAGTYTLSSGTLNVGNIEDGAGSSTFNLDGGTLNLTGSSMTLDTFNIGSAAGSNGSFRLGDGQALTTREERIGNGGGFAGAFSQSGGIHTVGLLVIDNGGSYKLSGGTVVINSRMLINNTGVFELAGGTVTGDGLLFIMPNETLMSGYGTITSDFHNLSNVAVRGGILNVSKAFDNDGIIMLDGGAATLSGGAIANGGIIKGNGIVANAIANAGIIESQAGVLNLTGTVNNNFGGNIVAGSGGKVVVASGLAENAGNIQLAGGTFDNNGFALVNAATGTISGAGTLRSGKLTNDGQVLLSGGVSAVHADLVANAGSQVILSGSSNTSFHGTADFRSGAELNVSAGSVATFFGAVSQGTGSNFTGAGAKFYEGGLSVGASPGFGLDAGNVAFGTGNLYLAEIGGTAAGSDYDFYYVEGTLAFGGTLKLVSWNGFIGQAGQSFDLFDWESASGRFGSIDSTGFLLAGGTVLDTSRLNIDGSISIAAVPEPETHAMMLAGLALLGAIVRRRMAA